MPRGKSVRTNRARDAFLKTFAETCNVSEAARSAGISRSAAYVWRDEDEAFARDWDEAEQEAIDKLEKVAWDRADTGKSDRMLEILLKAHRPEKYIERQHLKVEALDPVDVLKKANKRVRSKA